MEEQPRVSGTDYVGMVSPSTTRVGAVGGKTSRLGGFQKRWSLGNANKETDFTRRRSRTRVTKEEWGVSIERTVSPEGTVVEIVGWGMNSLKCRGKNFGVVYRGLVINCG